MSNKYIYITLLSALVFSNEIGAQTVSQAPKLVVSITVDELRTDHLETFAPLYSAGGLRKLLTEGAFYANASYSFTPVDRASAAASLSTGTTPYYHGITGEEWLDRSTLRPVRAVQDLKQGYSPRQLGTSTLGDELKIATNGIAKVFAFAATPDNAILSAGHAADGAAWIQSGKWSITNYYEPLNQWLRGYTRLYNPTTDTNTSVTEIALDCLSNGGLSLDDKTDLLCVGYSEEPQMESYVALDRTIALLVDSISKRVPLDRVLFVLTSTGSARVENEQNNNEKYRIPTGKFDIQRTANLLNQIRSGFNVEKCGDLLIDIAPGWELVNEQNHTSTTSRVSNIPFPIIFFGAGVKAQRIQTPVTTDAIAPTIARIIRIRAPNACATEPLF